MSKPRHLAPATILTLAALACAGAASAQTIRIGIAAPVSGASAVLGAELVAGARAVLATNAVAEGVEADTACTAEGGATAARRLVAAKVEIAIGFLCTESLEAALPILTAASIPVIDVGVRANRFTDRRAKTGDLIWRLAPRSDAEADAIARLLAVRWRDAPFGIVDDGTIYGRGLADAVRSRLEAAGLRAATIDTYRPAEEKQFGLVRRILATGVTHLFIAGDRPDIAVIARDATSIDLGLEIVGGEALIDEADPAVPLAGDITAIAPRAVLPQTTETATLAATGSAVYAASAYAAAEIALAAIETSRSESQPPASVLGGGPFDTVLGPVQFNAQGDGDLDLYRTLRLRGQDFVAEPEG